MFSNFNFESKDFPTPGISSTASADKNSFSFLEKANQKNAENPDIAPYTNEYSTALNQTANSFDMSIKSVEETVTSQGDELEEFRRENETYFHYTDDGMEIGKKQDGGVLPFSTLHPDTTLPSSKSIAAPTGKEE